MLDHWLSKRRKPGYNCADFAAEVLNVPPDALRGAVQARKGWRRLSVPEEGALCLLRPKIGAPHVGIYTNGGVLHLMQRTAAFQPMHIIERDYAKISFYVKCNNHN